MLNLSLTAVAREPVQLKERVPVDDPLWEDVGFTLREPLEVDLEARPVGEGVLVRGVLRARLAPECRRCLKPLAIEIDNPVDLLFEPMSAEEEEEFSGEVYPLPERTDQLDLGHAIREHLVLHIPEHVVCREDCQGLCPQCGTDLNESSCACEPEEEPGPWEALKNIKFD